MGITLAVTIGRARVGTEHGLLVGGRHLVGLAALAVDEGHLVEVRTFEHNDYYFKQAIRTYHIERINLAANYFS